MKVTVVDLEPAVRALIDDLEHLPTQPPSLYLDIEGVKLSRHGSMSIIQLFVQPKDHVFLVDVFVLKGAAFCTCNASGTNLRSILESALVPKVFFDVRNDSDALFSHFQISLAGVHDVQLLEVATRSSQSRERVAGLATCIKKDAQLTAEASALWKATKQKGLLLFEPEHGGSYEVFRSRPMLQDIVDYCAQDVVYLPVLWRVYTQKVSAEWMRKVQYETCQRILASQKASYEPHGKDKILSPWANPARSRQGQRSGDTGYGGPRTKTMTAVAQIAASEAARKTAVTRPDAKPEPQRSVGQEGPRQTESSAASEAATKIPEITAERPKSQPSKLNLPFREKRELGGRSRKKTDHTLYLATVHPKWTCITCSREMQQDQKEQHIAGKQHNARVKQTSGPQLGTPTETTLPPPTITAKNPQIRKLSPKATAPQTNRKTSVGATGIDSRKKSQAAVPKSQQRMGLPYPPDHLFLGFGGSGVRRTNRGGTSFSYSALDDVNYGLCDKDCGWCGHCMDGVDI